MNSSYSSSSDIQDLNDKVLSCKEYNYNYSLKLYTTLFIFKTEN
jgi:hypothetical protein